MTAKPSYLQLYLLPPGPCAYLEGRTEQKAATLVDPAQAHLAPLLIARGFRRSQGMFYRQRCVGCQACVASRIRLADFAPSRGFRRVLRKNEDLTVTVEPSVATFPLYDLFSEYLHARHPDGNMAEMSYGQFQQMMEDFPADTKFMVARRGDDIVGVMQFDDLPDGTSAVYSFFRPKEEKRSLGTWLVLKLAEHTAAAGKPYLYLGFWVKNSQKMEYKANYQPLELFIGEQWVPFTRDMPEPDTRDSEKIEPDE